MMVGCEFGGVEVSTSAGILTSDRWGLWMGFFLGEILVGSTDIDAVPPSGGTISCWRAS
jgi:hypothetical protein